MRIVSSRNNHSYYETLKQKFADDLGLGLHIASYLLADRYKEALGSLGEIWIILCGLLREKKGDFQVCQDIAKILDSMRNQIKKFDLSYTTKYQEINIK